MSGTASVLASTSDDGDFASDVMRANYSCSELKRICSSDTATSDGEPNVLDKKTKEAVSSKIKSKHERRNMFERYGSGGSVLQHRADRAEPVQAKATASQNFSRRFLDNQRLSVCSVTSMGLS